MMDEQCRRKLVVFDVCNTLFYSNTTFDFIYFFLKKHKKNWRIIAFKFFTSKYSPGYWVNAVLHKITSFDTSKYFALKLLTGFSKQQLDITATSFVKDFLISREIRQTHVLLCNLLKDGADVLLLSASIDPVIAAIAQHLKVNYKCSILAFKGNENFAGSFAEDISGKKETVLLDFMNNQKFSITVVTDNYADWELLKMANVRYAVVYNNKAEAFWTSLHPHFIRLQSS